MKHDNTNSGALFKNDKQGNDSRPDYRGSLNVNGTEFWISAWLKSSKAGTKYMSLSVQPKEGVKATRDNPRTTKGPADDLDNSIPF